MNSKVKRGITGVHIWAFEAIRVFLRFSPPGNTNVANGSFAVATDVGE